jgi:hypothetical protein
MTSSLKYNIKQISDISIGMQFEIPEETFNIINYLCSQVGSANISSKTFIKSAATPSSLSSSSSSMTENKKKRNKCMEVSAEEWENIRTPFQATKIEQKTGIDADINEMRLFLNKLSNKTFLDMREKILEKINAICQQYSMDDKLKVGNMLYDICSTNQFYSNIFVELFVELALKYEWVNSIFKSHYESIMDEYNNIQYIDSDKDYDGFCEMNKKNERRRSVTTFYVNLAINGFINKEKIIQMLRDILNTILDLTNIANKKNEVDELTEIVAILYNKNIIDSSEDTEDITDIIELLAQKKTKDCPSLSNKSIFKYMDLVEM